MRHTAVRDTLDIRSTPSSLYALTSILYNTSPYPSHGKHHHEPIFIRTPAQESLLDFGLVIAASLEVGRENIKMSPQFTGLPQEIRDAILELCLIVEGPINPYPTYYQDRNPFEKNSRKPDFALLTVNKKINAEASRLLYGGNLWKLNSRLGDHTENLGNLEPRDHFEPLEAWMLSNTFCSTHQAQIRHITLDLDARDLDATTLVKLTGLVYEELPSESDPVERVETIHYTRVKFLRLICGWKFRIIRNMQLKFACINVKDLFCINGCCRLGLIRSACFDYLRARASYVKLQPGRKIEGAIARTWSPEIIVVGLRNQDELTAGRDWWKEWYGTQLDYVTDMNGQQIGLKGFFETNNRKPDCT